MRSSSIFLSLINRRESALPGHTRLIKPKYINAAVIELENASVSGILGSRCGKGSRHATQNQNFFKNKNIIRK